MLTLLQQNLNLTLLRYSYALVEPLSQTGVQAAEESYQAGSMCYVNTAYYTAPNQLFVPRSISYRVDAASRSISRSVLICYLSSFMASSPSASPTAPAIGLHLSEIAAFARATTSPELEAVRPFPWPHTFKNQRKFRLSHRLASRRNSSASRLRVER